MEMIRTERIAISEEFHAIPADALTEAKIYESRFAMLNDLPKNLSFIEVGVAYGDFSEEIIKKCTPAKFIAVDHFGFESFPEIWGESPSIRFKGLSHEEFYKNRISELQKIYNFEYLHLPGNSAEMVLRGPNFDIAYIDAGHSFEDVALDTKSVISKLNSHGHIIFNDYIWRDTHNANIYGVVRVANKLIAEGGFKVRGLALNPKMFCDLWIQKI